MRVQWIFAGPRDWRNAKLPGEVIGGVSRRANEETEFATMTARYFAANPSPTQGFAWYSGRWLKLAKDGCLETEYMQQFIAGDDVEQLVAEKVLARDSSLSGGRTVRDCETFWNTFPQTAEERDFIAQAGHTAGGQSYSREQFAAKPVGRRRVVAIRRSPWGCRHLWQNLTI